MNDTKIINEGFIVSDILLLSNPYLLKHVNTKYNQKSKNNGSETVEEEDINTTVESSPDFVSSSTSLKSKSRKKKKNLSKQELKQEQELLTQEDNFSIESSGYSVKTLETIPISQLDGPIKLKGTIQLQELAQLFRIPSTEIIKFLFLKGIPSTINQLLDISVIQLIAEAFNQTVVFETDNLQLGDKIITSTSSHELQSRPPVITILGHVDHGKV